MPAEVDWNLLKQPDFLSGAVNAYQVGRQLAQQQGVQRAVANAFSDPQAAIQGALSYGDLADAGSLVGLQNNMSLNAMLARKYASMGGAPPSVPQPQGAGAPQPAAANGAPAPVAANAPPPGPPQSPTTADFANLSPAALAHASGIYDSLDRIGMQLAQLPYEQRAAALQQEKPALVQNGFPQQMIDSFNPTDANIMAVHAAAAQARGMMPGGAATAQQPTALSGAAGAAADGSQVNPALANAPPSGQAVAPQGAPQPAGSPQGGAVPVGAPAAAPPPNVSNAPMAPGAPAPQSAGQAPFWDLRNPQDVAILTAMDRAGINVGPLITAAEATMPKGEASRPGSFERDQFGHVIGQPAQDGRIYGTPNGDGSAPWYDPRSGTYGLAQAAGAADTVAALTSAKTSAEEGAKASYDMVATTDAAGRPLYQSGTQFAATHGGPGAPAGGAPPTAAGTVGQAPAAATYQAGQAKALNTTITGDLAARTAAMVNHDAALRIISTAQNLGPQSFNPATPAAYEGAKVFSALPPDLQQVAAAAMGTTPAKIGTFAANVANYEQATRSLMLTMAKTVLPSRYTERELNLLSTVYGKISDPQTAAVVMGGMLAATNEKVMQRSQFAQGYVPPSAPSGQGMEQDYEKAWANSPAGRQDVFASPTLQRVMVNGKPMVQPFMVKGVPYLAILPGLGKPTLIPANSQ